MRDSRVCVLPIPCRSTSAPARGGSWLQSTSAQLARGCSRPMSSRICRERAAGGWRGKRQWEVKERQREGCGKAAGGQWKGSRMGEERLTWLKVSGRAAERAAEGRGKGSGRARKGQRKGRGKADLPGAATAQTRAGTDGLPPRPPPEKARRVECTAISMHPADMVEICDL